MFRAQNPERYRRHLREGWPIVLSLLAITVVEQLLDSAISFGITPLDLLVTHEMAAPFWLAIVWGLFALTLVFYVTDHPTGEMRCGVVILAVSTAGLLTNVGELIRTLPQRTGSDGLSLLLDGGMIWVSNILVFTIWYWLVDSGGYLRRAEETANRRDFLFPLQATPQQGYDAWRPHYPDYLFLAVTTSTAFSPSDTQPLSWTAKLLQGSQALLSLVVTALIVARAVNILTTS
jgi:uncharacterized membrane protein